MNHIEVITDAATGEVTERALTPEQVLALFPSPTLESITAAINDHVEAVARARQYNSAANLASYTASTVPSWQAEALAFVAWRDQFFIAAQVALEQIGIGAVQPPESEAEFLAGLPVIQWPEASE